MAEQGKKAKTSWKDVKANLAGFDKTELTGLLHDLYAAQKESRAFLHARLGLGGGDVLAPYQKTIEQWLAPDPQGRKEFEISPSRARRAITDYQKAAARDRAGLAELLLFYCETAVRFGLAFGYDDGAYYGALKKVFGEALTVLRELPEGDGRSELVIRLDDLVGEACDLPYDVADEMEELKAQFKL